MDDPFSQLPKAAVLVYASVLTAAANNTAFAGQVEAEVATRAASQEAPQQAPTCGPACHDGNYQEYAPPVEPEPDPVAPTCGPSCHEGRSQESPPPIEEKQGRCAVAPEPEMTNLALLGLGLSFGVGASIVGRRRRRE
jgi:hypothetical protein